MLHNTLSDYHDELSHQCDKRVDTCCKAVNPYWTNASGLMESCIPLDTHITTLPPCVRVIDIFLHPWTPWMRWLMLTRIPQLTSWSSSTRDRKLSNVYSGCRSNSTITKDSASWLRAHLPVTDPSVLSKLMSLSMPVSFTPIESCYSAIRSSRGIKLSVIGFSFVIWWLCADWIPLVCIVWHRFRKKKVTSYTVNLRSYHSIVNHL